jgi:glycosyltransferase involved in cell wall biosynthesis
MPAHNEEKYIKKALESVFAQTVRPTKVIVILDRCTDKTDEMVMHFPVEVITKNKNEWRNSYAENLELARKYVMTDFYAIVDADVILEPNYFEVLLKEIKEDDACVGGRILTRCRTFICKFLSIWEHTYVLSPWKRPRGCALLIRKEVLNKIGGFADVPAPDTYIQELAIKMGYKVRVIKNAKAYHTREITVRRAIKTQFQTGIARYVQGIGFMRTLLHSVIRLRPFVILGYLYAWLINKFRSKQLR